MKTLVFLFALAAGTAVLSAQISIGVRIGPPPPPRVVRVLPHSPGPDFMWVAGYWYPYGGRYAWRGGYWARPPYAGAYWVGPRYYGHRYYPGYWGRGYYRR